MRDRVAVLVDADADAGGRRPVHRRLGLLGPERLLEERGNAPVQAADAGEHDHREEHGGRRRDRGGRPHGEEPRRTAAGSTSVEPASVGRSGGMEVIGSLAREIVLWSNASAPA